MLDSMIDFLEPINMAELSGDEGFKDTQLGKHVLAYEDYLPEIETADLVMKCGVWVFNILT
jgi:formiminoglutamase